MRWIITSYIRSMCQVLDDMDVYEVWMSMRFRHEMDMFEVLDHMDICQMLHHTDAYQVTLVCHTCVRSLSFVIFVSGHSQLPYIICHTSFAIHKLCDTEGSQD